MAVLDGKLKVPDAVTAWRQVAGITAGPLFRGCDRGRLAADRLSDRQFARVLKARCDIGLDPDLIGGHSPRQARDDGRLHGGGRQVPEERRQGLRLIALQRGPRSIIGRPTRGLALLIQRGNSIGSIFT